MTSLDDAAPIDQMVPIDAAPLPVDAPASTIDAPPAGPTPVARWRFESNLDDDTNNHDAIVVGTAPSYVAGPSGNAVRFAANGHLRIADSSRLDLPSGRIELRYRFSASSPAGDLGLFSRDANGTSLPGHVGIRIGHDRRLVARIQNTSGEAYRCTQSPIAPDTWHTVELRFGPAGLVLRQDGATVSGTSWTNSDGGVHSCTTAWTGGIDGNDNPIVLGALTLFSAEGEGTTAFPATGVDLDDVALWADP